MRDYKLPATQCGLKAAGLGSPQVQRRALARAQQQQQQAAAARRSPSSTEDMQDQGAASNSSAEEAVEWLELLP